MSITIIRSVPIINNFIQYLPTLEQAKTTYEVEADDHPDIVEFSHKPQNNNRFFIYDSEELRP